MKKIVCFGGGNAMPNVVLQGLKKYVLNITSITSMVDNGGSSGRLRKELNVLPPGDIRRHLIVLSNAPEWKKKLFNLRFGSERFDNKHKGHPFGNFFLAGLEYTLKDYEKVLDIIHDFLEIKYNKVLPATIEKTHVFAELENGEIIKGEKEIDISRDHDKNIKIKKIFLKPEVKAYTKVLGAIKEADLISIGPGDMYSSLMPCFLPKGIKESIQKSNAKKIFICPPLTKLGETNNFSVKIFAEECEKYIGCSLDNIFYENSLNFGSFKNLTITRIDKNLDKNRFIGNNFLKNKCDEVYDPDKVAKKIMEILLCP